MRLSIVRLSMDPILTPFYSYPLRLSVIADMEQLMDNCYKYNGDDNDFYDLACEMYDRFKSLVDAIEEPPTFDIDHMTAEEINDHAVESIPAAHAQDRSRIEGASDEDGEQSQQAQSIVNGRDKLNEANKRRPVRGRSEPLEDVQHSRSQRSSERKHPVRATRSKQIERKSENDVDSDCSSEKDNRNDRVSSSRASGKAVPAEGAYEREVGSRRKSSRTKIMPSYCDRGSEEEDGSEDSAESENGEDSESEDDSDGDVPAVGRNTRTRSTRKMPSRDKQEPNKSIAVRRKAGETSALRISLRAKSKPMYAEKDSDEDDSGVDVSVPGAGNRKLSGGKKTSSNTRLSQRQKRKPIENSGRRLSSRARLKTESLEGVGSENSSEDESVGEASAAKENTRNGRPSRASNRSSYFEKDCNTISDSQVIGRRMSPRAKSARKVYADIDSYSESRSEDEGESESEDDSTSEEEETNRNSRKRGLRHSDASAKKRARTQRHSTKIQTYPELEKWKSISKRKIFSIGNAILGKLVRFDLWSVNS